MSNLKKLFSFSKTERNGILILSVAVIILTSFIVFDSFSDPNLTSQDFSQFNSEIATFNAVEDSIRKRSCQKKKYKKSTPYKYSKTYSNKNLDKGNVVEKTEEIFVVEINSASAKELQKLRGIGEVLSKRIVKFRNSLGGFYSMNQLADVYGVKQEVLDSNKSHLTINLSNLKKASINLSEFKQLLKHPYLNYEAVKCIFGFRNKSDSVSVDQAVNCVQDSLKSKLKPYLIP